MKLTTRCEQGACISLETLTTPCDNSACIGLIREGEGLVLSTTNSTGSVVVTAQEVRMFSAAVQSGYFDALLGD